MSRAATLLILTLASALATWLSHPTLATAASPEDAQATRAAQSVRRYALLVGANDGGTARVKLRYAARDARAVGAVLAELGGIASSDQLLVVDPSPQTFDAAITRLGARIKREGAGRVEVLIYYSGHSDEHGLLLQGQHVGYERLRAHLKALPADVRVLILDSCASGMMTRTKGGRRTPAFLRDEAMQVRGHAILTSSSDTESAQESDRLKGSFFTHAFISGLRGAADVTGDRRVTLNEAYQFAFRETLERTQKTRGGAQHPAYDIQLTGHGDLILTDLSQTSAALRLGEDVGGRLFIRDPQGRLVAELYKAPGRPLELGLPADAYTVGLARGEGMWEAKVTVRAGQVARLDLRQFGQVGQEPTRLRGGEATDEGTVGEAHVADQRAVIGFRPSVYSFGMDLVPYVGTSSWGSAHPRAYSLNLIGGLSGGLRGLEIGGAFNLHTGDVRGLQIGGAANLVGGDVAGGQIGGAVNVVDGDVWGLQIGGAANIVTGHAGGLQIGGALNVVNEGFRGVQIGGAANIVTGDAAGLLIAGGLNLTRGEVYGVQIAGINMSTGRLRGGQLGAINLAEDVRGAQIGAINVARNVSGVQLGAINIARRDAITIGAINIFTDGDTRATTWLNESGFLQAGVRHGGDHIYTILAAGAYAGERSLVASIGMGWQGNLSRRLGLQADVMHQRLFLPCCGWGGENSFNKLRILASWRPVSWFAIYGGPTATVMVSEQIHDPFVRQEIVLHDENYRVAMWPGFALGVELF